ncbi:MAG: tRNA-dihydrouridine synthase family protein, partial [Proteobacteria bacterium]|nr:tRNA-dihydrouridine synthase family protein [Pseudomonadota bacterium]
MITANQPSVQNIFTRMGLPPVPVILAPLAGVSDHPFRRICAEAGAHLTYVEMISATALLYESRRTFDMLKRHDSENILGVQITGKSADEVGRAIEILDRMPFDTIDINMGCPVSKVVKTGCGSGILRDPERVFQTVKMARAATSKPLSAKFRLGWDKASINWREVSDAIESGGADWMTIHGRLRSDDYGAPVNLEDIAALKHKSKIPVIGNGNIFSRKDWLYMQETTGVD